MLKAGLEGRQEWWRDEWDGFPHVLCATFLPASLWPAKAMMFIRWGSIYSVIYRRVLATLAFLVVLVTLMTLTALAVSSLAPLLWRISLAFGSSPAGIHPPGVRRTQPDRLRGRTRTSPTATPATLPKKKATFPVFFCAAVARRYAHPSSHHTRLLRGQTPIWGPRSGELRSPFWNEAGTRFDSAMIRNPCRERRSSAPDRGSIPAVTCISVPARRCSGPDRSRDGV